MTTLRSHFYVFVASLIISGSFLIASELANSINPISLTLLRFICAASILAPFVLIKRQYRQKILNVIPRSLIISLFYSGFFIIQFESLKTTSAINTGTLYTLVPLITAILGVFIFKEHITLKRLFVYLLAAIGTCWVIFNGDLNALLNFSLNKGDLLFLLGCLVMCFYSLSMKLLYRNDPLILLVFCTLLCGCFWMGLFLLISGTPLNWQSLDRLQWGYIGYLGIFATLLTSYLYQKTTITLGPRKVMSYIYLNPALVVMLSFIVYQTKISLYVLPGIALSAIATVLLQKNK